MKAFGFTETEFYAIAQRAYELALQGAYEPAAVLLEGLNAVDPGDRYSLLTLAAVRLKESKAAEAVALLEQRLRDDANDSEARLLLLEACMAAGADEEAERQWTRIQASGLALPRRLALRWRAFRDPAHRALMGR
jgi:predicted Zn-dependent protease